MHKTLLLGLALVLGTSATAAVTAEGDTKSGADERRVCRSEGQVGSRLRQRVCMTRAQWREVDQRRRVHREDQIRDADNQAPEHQGTIGAPIP